VIVTTQIELAPAQRLAAERLAAGVRAADVVLFKAGHGAGRTTVLRHAQAATRSAFAGAREFMTVLAAHPPAALEEAIVSFIEGALDKSDAVIVDDLYLLYAAANCYENPRRRLFHVALTALLDTAAVRHKRLLFAWNDHDDVPQALESRAFLVEMGEFQPADYETICRAYLAPRAAGKLDYAEIHRFAPELNAHQLANACRWIEGGRDLDTAGFIAHLTEKNLASNVELEQVAPVDWKDLKGFDDVIEALEAKIALPFENHALAVELQLRPKRGVLLAGPPGTGKTTIGRALAARLKSKFFLIDGTVIEGACDFYEKVTEIFEAAKRNAPSVVFIDDCDLLFENSGGRGFHRYLLTMLDGLESAKAERVCVIVTAMNVSSLPAALIRSGRIELWLETRLPDMAARTAILSARLAQLPAPLGNVDARVIAEASERLTGADLRAVVEDGKLLFARDKVRGLAARPGEEYFLEAVAALRATRRGGECGFAAGRI
jgi:predicted AAA+ superfamily ATPase